MDLVIAVGGGGQHIALTVARLVRLGALDEPVEAVVIDADTESKLALRLRTFANTVGPLAPHPLRGAETVVPAFARDAMPDTRFRKLFLDAAADPLERELFELFYDEASGGNDTLLSGVDIARGMHGNPSVGSAVFASSAIDVLEPLFAKAHVANRVYVVGSFLGGTGAGIVHQLVALLRKSIDRKPIGLYGAFLLRWFDLPAMRGDTVDNATLLASMGHGLEYFFRHTRHMLDASLLVGVPDQPAIAILEAARARADNDEVISIYPLLAAHGIVTLPAKTDLQARTAHTVYGVAFDETDPFYPLGAAWGGHNAPSRDASLGARIEEALVITACVSSFRARATHFANADFPDANRTWGPFFAAAARAAQDTSAAFARKVLDALEARAAQLRVATDGVLGVYGGSVDLGELGDPGAREAYKRLQSRRFAHADAFELFNRAHAQLAPVTGAIAPGDLAAQIERALRFVLRQ